MISQQPLNEIKVGKTLNGYHFIHLWLPDFIIQKKHVKQMKVPLVEYGFTFSQAKNDIPAPPLDTYRIPRVRVRCNSDHLPPFDDVAWRLLQLAKTYSSQPFVEISEYTTEWRDKPLTKLPLIARVSYAAMYALRLQEIAGETKTRNRQKL